VIFQGNDARRRGFAKNFEINFANVQGTFSYLGDVVKRYQSFLFGVFSHDIYYLNPDLGHVLPARARFLAYPSVFVDDFRPHYPSRKRHLLVVGHAPTSRSIKGTDLLLEAISQLQAEGIAIDLKLVENKSHAEALEEYKEVDVFVDQLYAGWYGAVAVELMALGKPVVAYIRENDMVFVDQAFADELPIIECTPGNIKELLLALATTRRAELRELGRRGRRFAKRWHDPNAIAASLVDVIRTKDESQRAKEIS
jgi:glycosyltransferase involved in cell wall biosynthesis